MTEKRKLRWFQFSLRTLLIFALIVSIGMSWLGVKLDRARKQKAAVAAIRKAGGRVVYDPSAKRLVPEWTRALFGDDFFFDVVAVGASHPDFGDNDAAYLKGLTNLQSLDLSGTQVTGPGLEHLEGLTSLIILSLGGSQVTDAGLEHLEGLTNLGRLSLADTQVTDAGLEHLKGLTSLSDLSLSGTQVSTEGVESLSQALPYW